MVFIYKRDQSNTILINYRHNMQLILKYMYEMLGICSNISGYIINFIMLNFSARFFFFEKFEGGKAFSFTPVKDTNNSVCVCSYFLFPIEPCTLKINKSFVSKRYINKSCVIDLISGMCWMWSVYNILTWRKCMPF